MLLRSFAVFSPTNSAEEPNFKEFFFASPAKPDFLSVAPWVNLRAFGPAWHILGNGLGRALA
jgi:hypothetical protein